MIIQFEEAVNFIYKDISYLWKETSILRLKTKWEATNNAHNAIIVIRQWISYIIVIHYCFDCCCSDPLCQEDMYDEKLCLRHLEINFPFSCPYCLALGFIHWNWNDKLFGILTTWWHLLLKYIFWKYFFII